MGDIERLTESSGAGPTHHGEFLGAEPLTDLVPEVERLTRERDDWKRWFFEHRALLGHLIGELAPPPIVFASEPDGVFEDGTITVTDMAQIEVHWTDDLGRMVVARYGADSEYAAALAEIERWKERPDE